MTFPSLASTLGSPSPDRTCRNDTNGLARGRGGSAPLGRAQTVGRESQPKPSRRQRLVRSNQARPLGPAAQGTLSHSGEGCRDLHPRETSTPMRRPVRRDPSKRLRSLGCACNLYSSVPSTNACAAASTSGNLPSRSANIGWVSPRRGLAPMNQARATCSFSAREISVHARCAACRRANVGCRGYAIIPRPAVGELAVLHVGQNGNDRGTQVADQPARKLVAVKLNGFCVRVFNRTCGHEKPSISGIETVPSRVGDRSLASGRRHHNVNTDGTNWSVEDRHGRTRPWRPAAGRPRHASAVFAPPAYVRSPLTPTASLVCAHAGKTTQKTR